jgi:hypothetical protein
MMARDLSWTVAVPPEGDGRPEDSLAVTPSRVIRIADVYELWSLDLVAPRDGSPTERILTPGSER